MSSFLYQQKLLQELEAQRDFDFINNQLLNNELPVIQRPKAVLELWQQYEILLALEKRDVNSQQMPTLREDVLYRG
jgi:hypothetical protein